MVDKGLDHRSGRGHCLLKHGVEAYQRTLRLLSQAQAFPYCCKRGTNAFGFPSSIKGSSKGD